MRLIEPGALPWLVLPPLGRWALLPCAAFWKWWQKLQPLAIFAVFRQKKSGDRKNQVLANLWITLLPIMRIDDIY